MGMGNLRYTVTFYPQACLVHVNLAPLVVTLVHKDGDGETPNFGYTLGMIPELTLALEPLRQQVRARGGWRDIFYSERSVTSAVDVYTQIKRPLTTHSFESYVLC